MLARAYCAKCKAREDPDPHCPECGTPPESEGETTGWLAPDGTLLLGRLLGHPLFPELDKITSSRQSTRPPVGNGMLAEVDPIAEQKRKAEAKAMWEHGKSLSKYKP